MLPRPDEGKRGAIPQPQPNTPVPPPRTPQTPPTAPQRTPGHPAAKTPSAAGGHRPSTHALPPGGGVAGSRSRGVGSPLTLTHGRKSAFGGVGAYGAGVASDATQRKDESRPIGKGVRAHTRHARATRPVTEAGGCVPPKVRASHTPGGPAGQRVGEGASRHQDHQRAVGLAIGRRGDANGAEGDPTGSGRTPRWGRPRGPAASPRMTVAARV